MQVVTALKKGSQQLAKPDTYAQVLLLSDAHVCRTASGVCGPSQ